MFNLEMGAEGLRQNQENFKSDSETEETEETEETKKEEEKEEYNKFIEKIEKAEKENKAEQDDLMQRLSKKEVSAFQKTKEKIKKGCKIGIVGTMIVTSLLAAGCGAEKSQEIDHWSQVNIEEARETVPGEVIKGWVDYGLRSIGGWKEDGEDSLVMIGSGRHYYRITQENLEKFKHKIGDEISQFLYYSTVEISRDKNVTGKLLDARIKTFFAKYVENAMENDMNTVAHGFFEKASSNEWQQLEDYIYFGVEQSGINGEEDEVKQSPDLSNLDPTLK